MPPCLGPWTRICPKASTNRRPLLSRLREPSSTELRKTSRTSSQIPCRSPLRRAGAAVRSRRSSASLRRSYQQSPSSHKRREGCNFGTAGHSDATVVSRRLHSSYEKGCQEKKLLPAPLRDAGVVTYIQPQLVLGRVIGCFGSSQMAAAMPTPVACLH